MRIQPLEYPPVQLVEAFPDLAATQVVSPSSDDRVIVPITIKRRLWMIGDLRTAFIGCGGGTPTSWLTQQ
jgi:hypothetical protein